MHLESAPLDDEPTRLAELKIPKLSVFSWALFCFATLVADTPLERHHGKRLADGPQLKIAIWASAGHA
jgi:hypothetical protein